MVVDTAVYRLDSVDKDAKVIVRCYNSPSKRNKIKVKCRRGISSASRVRISDKIISFSLPVFKWSLPLLSQFLANVYMTQLLDEPGVD